MKVFNIFKDMFTAATISKWIKILYPASSPKCAKLQKNKNKAHSGLKKCLNTETLKFFHYNNK